MSTKSTDASIEQLKRKAYLGYHGDGILDLLLGSTMLGIALWLLLDSIFFTFMAWMGFILYAGMKNSITIPRFGYVSFDETKTRYARTISVGVLLLLLSLVVGILFFMSPDRIPPSVSQFLRNYFEYMLAGLCSLVMVLMGALSGIKRFTGYAGVTIVALWLSLQLQLNPVTPLLVMGSLILLIGTTLMVNFIRRHPLQSSET